MPVPEGIPSDIYTGFNLVLWIGAIVVHIFATILITKKGKQIDFETFRKLLFSYALFSMLLGLNRIFFLWAYLSAETSNYNIGLGIGYIFASLALIPIIYVMEKHMVQNKTHYLFSITAILLACFAGISLVLPDSLMTVRTTLQLASLIPSFIWFFLYVWIIKSTTGAPRTKAIFIVLSVIISLIGFTLDSERILALQIIPTFIAPVLYILGLVCLIIVLTREDKTE